MLYSYGKLAIGTSAIIENTVLLAKKLPFNLVNPAFPAD
jgi:hypothetical protein